MAEGLRLETVDAGMLSLLKRLMADKQLDDFNLVGGTALSLRLGHRKSVDLDLFRSTDFDSGQLAKYLKERYNAAIHRQLDNRVHGYIGNVKVDMLTDPFPLIDKIENAEGIRMLSLRDIGAMKMTAMFDNGKRMKDFADMYALLEKHPLNTYVDYAMQKFPEINPEMLRKSLLYHKDVNLKTKVEYIGKPVEWRSIVNRLRQAFHNPTKVFGQSIILKNDQRVDKARRLRRGHRPG